MAERDDDLDFLDDIPDASGKGARTGAPAQAPAAGAQPADGRADDQAGENDQLRVELDLDDDLFGDEPALMDEPPAPQDMETPDDAPVAAPRRRRGKRLKLMFGLAVLALAGGLAVFLLLIRPVPLPPPPEPSKAAPVAPAAPPPPTDPRLRPECRGKATPEELVDLVHQATRLLVENEAEGLRVLSDPRNLFVCRETYIVVFEARRRTIVANPVVPRLVGMDLSPERTVDGTPYVSLVARLAARPRGGWFAKTQPLNDNSEERGRKIFYVMQAPGLPYQVAAGIWDEDSSVEELNARLDQSSSPAAEGSSGPGAVAAESSSRR